MIAKIRRLMAPLDKLGMLIFSIKISFEKKWHRWRAGIFLKRLRRMLLKLSDKLKNAGYTRHERRRISREILKNIESAVSTFLKE